MRIVKVSLLLLMLLTLAASALQSVLGLLKEPDLKGYYHKNAPPSLNSFTREGWLNSTFQHDYSTNLTDYAGLRNLLISVSNQVDYSLFGIIHAAGFILGKEGYLFEEDYIHEYTGEFFIGKPVIDEKLARLKNVTDSLKAYGIPLLLVFEPGKASFYPEFIPDRFHPEKRTQTNYDYMVKRSQESGLNLLDLNSYFLQLKETSHYPLFPKYGMHWSLYGVPFAVDTLAKAIEQATGTQLPEFTTDPLIASTTPRGTDNDIGELLNLLCPLKPAPGAYPTITFDPSVPRSLSALVIADSYYINIVETYGRKLFQSQDYWYYNKKIYPYQNQDPPPYVDKTNLREKLKKYQIILLMSSEINLHCGFWNFADEAFMAFHPEIQDSPVNGVENDIRNDRDWFRFMVKKAQAQNRPLDELIREDAIYSYGQSKKNQ